MSESFFHEEEQEDHFFDASDDISSASSSCPGSPAGNSLLSDGKMFSKWAFWLEDPDSVRARRNRFMRSMGLDQMNWSCTESESEDGGESKVDYEDRPNTGRNSTESEAILRSSFSENTCSMSDWSSEETSVSYDHESLKENFVCKLKNLDDDTTFVANELGKDGKQRSLREIDSKRTLGLGEFEKILGSSSLIKRFMRKESNTSIRHDKSANSNCEKSARSTTSWLKRLGAAAYAVDAHRKEIHSKLSGSNDSRSPTSGRIKICPHRKQQKELSATFNVQDIKAHDGAILTMKFSPDGQYLATGGEDGVVRVWHVSKSPRIQDFCIPEDDPSCAYFIMNHSSELIPANSDKVKKIKPWEFKKSSSSTFAVIPDEVFHLSIKPIHEFRGHDGNVLDLSWSKSKYLLSSSIDKTVRLWQIGSQNCLKVFPHKNYVTCVQFNPIEEDFFISGSIDGKLRIWEIPGCRVVHWADVREIVTAVCYRPDGKGVVAGTLTGNCCFYETPGNHLEINFHLTLQRKKKSPFKRITGFQFCPSNPRKLMVISADSKIHILDGADVVSKFKGPRSSGDQVSASFTADGRHIISSSENSNVYIWNHDNLDMHISNHVTRKCSFEWFLSSNSIVAIPWNGFQSRNLALDSTALHLQQETSRMKVSHQYRNCHEEDSFGFVTKGSATWPEEKLPSKSTASTFYRSHYKFLKTSSQYKSHAWGQVIVTAGWDGCIRSYQNFGLPLCL